MWQGPHAFRCSYAASDGLFPTILNRWQRFLYTKTPPSAESLDLQGGVQTPDASHATTRGDGDASTLFHPDCTVGPGFSPDLLRPKRRRSRAWRVTRHTAGRESHPALKVVLLNYQRGTRQARLSRRTSCSRITTECTLRKPDLPRGGASAARTRGAAFVALAGGAQLLVGVDAGVVAVAPDRRQAVAPNGLDLI